MNTEDEAYLMGVGVPDASSLEHVCHWPGCGKPVPPKMWGCKPHWFSLSGAIRRRIWLTYRKGQEIDKKPSPEYLAAALEARMYALAKIAQNKETR